MIHVANTVTYDMANDVESFNKEMASDILEWHVMHVSCILFVLRPEVGTLSTAFFADMTFL